MLSKFKIIGLNSFKLVKRTLPQLQSTVKNQYYQHHNDDYNNNETNKKSSLLFNKRNYLLVSIFSLSYLDRKYDLFKNSNFFNEFKVSAKESKINEKSDDIVLLNKNHDKQKSIDSNHIRKAFNFIADTAEKAMPSVVQILVYGVDPYFNNKYKISSGTGFIVSKDGLILTNAHVVAGSKNVQVVLQNGKEINGKVECAEENCDLALIKINENNLPVLEFENSSGIRIGEFVVAIGYPLNLNNTVTSGIISSLVKGKNIGLPDNEMTYIQTDASINIGNSGGPLLTLNGGVIGINTYQVANGINMALLSDYAIKFIEYYKSKSNMMKEEIDNKKYLGLTMISLTKDVLKEFRKLNNNLDNKIFDNLEHGVFLCKIAPDSIASRVGLKENDIIIEIDNEKIFTATDVYKAINNSKSFSILVLRLDKKIRFNINLV